MSYAEESFARIARENAAVRDLRSDSPMLRHVLFGLVIVSSLSVASNVRADCAQGSNYAATTSGNTVTIGLDQTQRTCPDASGMLRQNTVTGEVAVLASFCGKGSFNDSAYIDECVAPGTYRYGLALPFDCSEPGCGGVDMYTEVTVTAALSSTCARAASDPGPTVTNEVPPWGTGAEPTSFKSCPHGGCFCNTTSASVVSMNAFALGIGLVVLGLARLRKR
jgi:hypothetical protein